MKNIMIFSISFILLFSAFQILSGYFLTFFYTPNITSAWNQADNLSGNVIIKGGSFLIPLLFAFLVVIIFRKRTR